jgi:hypothetical protein
MQISIANYDTEQNHLGFEELTPSDHELIGTKIHHSSLPAELQGRVHSPLHQALFYRTQHVT